MPMMLMLGSVYAHSAAAGLEWDAARLADEKARVEAEAERLDVKLAELSRPERVRSIAERDLGMRGPEGEHLMTFDGSNEEDATQDVEEDK
jgi:cell division protein FtsL